MRLLGQGSFGEVWEATQVALGRRVAVKLLIAGLLDNPTTVERFLAEARITASLSHPHIVIVLDHGVEGAIPWIVFEFVPGKTLREVLAARGRFVWREASQTMVQLLCAIEESHARGILHRDIKPANVLEVEPGRYKVADFGVAKWADEMERLTRTGAIVGTPAYLSPEQLSNQPASERSDIYALGLMHYELLTGRLAFPGTKLSDIVHGHLSVPPPRASALAADVPPAVDEIILATLVKDPAQRMPSAKAYREALEAQLAAAPRRTRREPRITGKVASVAPPAAGSWRTRIAAIAAAVMALAVLAATFRARPPAAAPVAPSATARATAPHEDAAVTLIALEAEALHQRYRSRGEDYMKMAQLLGQDPLTLQPEQAAQLAGSLAAVEKAELALIVRQLERLGEPRDEAPLAEHVTRVRLTALEFLDWERSLHAQNAIDAVKRYDREGALAGLAAMGSQMEKAIFGTEGVQRLRRFFQAVVGTARCVAERPQAPADLTAVCEDLDEIAHRYGYMKWLEGPRREVGALAGSFREDLERIPAGRVLRIAWDLKDYNRERRHDAGLRASAAVTLRAARLELPGMAATLDHLEAKVR